MSGNQLAFTHVINVSVAAAQQGAGRYNTSNLAIFSRESFDEESFGDLGYKIYLSPTEVGEDFGTTSVTYKMALKVFSQQPNILAGGGYLVVIPFVDTAPVTEVQNIAFPFVPAAGVYKLKYGAEETSALNWDDTAAELQTALRLLTGLGSVTVSGDTTEGFVVTFTGVSGDASLLSVPAASNSLQSSTPANVEPVVTVTTPGTTTSTETLDEAILRTKGLIQYFGIMAAEIESESDVDDAADLVQTLNKILFVVSRTQADIEPGGMFDDIALASLDHTRCLYYGDDNDLAALEYMAAYAGRALSVNFSGSNTTITMHMKTLTGIEPDPTMTETIFALAEAVGADIYASFEGVPKTFCFNANTFFDRVYNRLWFAGALIVSGFNFFATVPTKIPQTEGGMDALKGTYAKVCEQAKTNQYIAPGTWNSPVTFGDQVLFLQNILQQGYYIYSQPISQQSQEEREDRQAPLCQIAIKEAGALQESSVIVYINP